MRHIRGFIVIAFCMSFQTQAYSQETIDIETVIHESIENCRQDYFHDCRSGFSILKTLPCDILRDTIYAIEEYSFENGSCEVMCWSKDFVYTINGTFDQEFRVYNKRSFGKWLVSLVERWDTLSILDRQEELGGPDENYTIVRIIIDSGDIHTDLIECHKQLSAPITDWEDVNNLLKIWENVDDYIFLYDCSQ